MNKIFFPIPEEVQNQMFSEHHDDLLEQAYEDNYFPSEGMDDEETFMDWLSV